MARSSISLFRFRKNVFLVGVGACLVMVVPDALAKQSERPEPAPAATPAPEVSTFSTVAALGTKLAWRSGRTPQLLWTGFRTRTDGDEVLLQTSSEVTLETRESKDGPVFILKGCHTLRRTDRLPLETRYFDSPITRVSLKQHAGDLEIAISLRHPAAAVSRKEAGPAGSWFWVLQFASPHDAPTATAAATP